MGKRKHLELKENSAVEQNIINKTKTFVSQQQQQRQLQQNPIQILSISQHNLLLGSNNLELTNILPVSHSHHLPPSTMIAGSPAVPLQSQQPPSQIQKAALPPTITITSTEESPECLDGMLDRISHDLDYLLNRITEIPITTRPAGNANTRQSAGLPQPAQPSTQHSNTSTILTSHSVHEVILEESEDTEN